MAPLRARLGRAGRNVGRDGGRVGSGADGVAEASGHRRVSLEPQGSDVVQPNLLQHDVQPRGVRQPGRCLPAAQDVPVFASAAWCERCACGQRRCPGCTRRSRRVLRVSRRRSPHRFPRRKPHCARSIFCLNLLLTSSVMPWGVWEATSFFFSMCARTVFFSRPVCARAPSVRTVATRWGGRRARWCGRRAHAQRDAVWRRRRAKVLINRGPFAHAAVSKTLQEKITSRAVNANSFNVNCKMIT